MNILRGRNRGVHWRVQICHKNLSVVYDIKSWFLLFTTALRQESEPCYLYTNALQKFLFLKSTPLKNIHSIYVKD